MRRRRIEVIARAVQIHRQQEDRVEAVLLAVRLRLHQHHLLGKTVRRVGLFRISVPQFFFSKWNRRVLRIRADRAQRNEFLHAALASFFDQLDPHDQIVVEVAPRIFLIGADPAYDRRKMNHKVRPGGFIEPLDSRPVPEVVLGRPRNRDRLTAGRPQPLDHVRAEKARASRNHYPPSSPEPALHRPVIRVHRYSSVA